MKYPIVIKGLPLSIANNKKKKWIMSLNGLLKMHHMTRDRLKKKFYRLVYPKIKNMPVIDRRVVIFYYITFPSKHGRDIDNYGFAFIKFFNDALQVYGKIANDDFNYIKSTVPVFLKCEKGKALVDVYIWEDI